MSEIHACSASPAPPDRRSFLQSAGAVAMAGGLVAGYGTMAVMAGRFLYPPEDRSLIWQFVGRADDWRQGGSIDYTAPDGSKVVVTRQGEGLDASAFVAFSSICPHLGCQVHWEANNQRFFCPCHNGAFDASGQAIAGPPAKARQQLSKFPVRVEDGLIYIQVPSAGLVALPTGAP